MQTIIDLNCDLGEGAGHDEEIMACVSSASIACGAHAGDLETMIEAIELAAKRKVAVGAHPGYFDLENFGRIERAIAPDEASRLVLMQVEQFYEAAGDAMRHVKLHGALYNQVCRDTALAEAVVADLGRLWPQLTIFALAGSVFAQVTQARGLRVAEEAFADRRYRRDGSLVPRSEPGATIEDETAVVAQVLGIARDGLVRSADGAEVRIRADTICLHGDGPNAVALARRIKAELKSAGVKIKACAAKPA